MLGIGIWRLESGAWDLVLGIWHLGFGAWNLVLGAWHLDTRLVWLKPKDHTKLRIFTRSGISAEQQWLIPTPTIVKAQ